MRGMLVKGSHVFYFGRGQASVLQVWRKARPYRIQTLSFEVDAGNNEKIIFSGRR